MISPTARQHDKSSGDESEYTFPQRSFRVLMIAASPFPLPQGSQVLIAGLSESLQQRGHQVEIVAYPTGKKRPHLSVPIRRAPSIPLYRHLNPGPSFWKPLMDVILAREVLSSVRQKRPDILHTHNFEGLLVGLWVSRKTHIPVVYHLHNLMEPELPAYVRFWT
jgi:glycosyltransferase involved in cell wall biosynthesis